MIVKWSVTVIPKLSRSRELDNELFRYNINSRVRKHCVKLSQDVHYRRNIVATPGAVSLLGLSKFPAFDPKGAAPQVIIWVTWHPWRIRSGDGSAPRVTRGPFYNISRDNYERVAKLPSPRFFIIENRVVAISLAPYLNFDENVIYEMDDVDGLVIYERYFLESAR